MSNMVVRTNMLALNSHRNLGMVSTQQARASARLSSGFRINSAADDAAGLGISENMRAQIRGLDQASRNAQDGISLIQTAEGGMSTVNDMIIRIRELTVQAANDINTHYDSPTTAGGTAGNNANRARIQNEVEHLIAEIARTADTLQFNSMTLLNGDFDGQGMMTVGGQQVPNNLWFQIGANSQQGIVVELPNIFEAVAMALHSIFQAGFTLEARIPGVSGATVGNVPNQPVSTGSIISGNGQSITALLDQIDDVLGIATAARGALGAIQNRLEFTIQNLDVASENLSASNSRIRDADMAAEMMRLTQANVLQQAATAMLAQGNQAPQSILQLLG